MNFSNVNDAKTAEEAARMLYQLGAVPLTVKGKAPTDTAWQETTYKNEEEIAKKFKGWPGNVGILTTGHYLVGNNSQETLDAFRAECPFYDETTQRVGKNPFPCALFKRVNKTDFPKTKILSKEKRTLCDLWADKAQFVAWGTHPDDATIKYKFLNDKPPLPITDDYIFDLVRRVAARLGVENPYAKKQTSEQQTTQQTQDNIFARVKAKVRVSDVLGTARGQAQVRIMCPLHKQGTSNPGAIIYDDSSIYCHSSGCQADVIGLYAHQHGLGQFEAAKELAQQYGIELPQQATAGKKVKRPLEFFETDAKGIRHFIAARVAAHLIETNNIFTTRDKDKVIWRYNGTGWQDDGLPHLQEQTKELLDEDFSKNRCGEVIAHTEASTYKEEPPEPPANHIALENTVYDLNTGELQPYSPDFFYRNRSPIVYAPEATCPKIIKFIQEVMPDEKKQLLLFEVAGYCLYRSYEIQKAIMLVGEGCNGKSTYISLVKALLGEKNVSARTMQELEHNRFAAACLKGKLANMFADLPPQALKSTSFFKTLTGGDFLETERKYGREPAKFTNTAKLIFSANEPPESFDNTNAFWRRFVLVEFPVSFEGKENKKLLKELTTPEEMSGFLNMSLQALKRLLERGTFSYEKTSDETRQYYRNKMSSVSAFIDDELEADATMFETTETLYDTYIQYCKEHHLRAESETGFVEKLKRFFPGQIDSIRPLVEKRRRKGLAGLKLKSRTTALKIEKDDEYGSLTL